MVLRRDMSETENEEHNTMRQSGRKMDRWCSHTHTHTHTEDNADRDQTDIGEHTQIVRGRRNVVGL